MKLLCMAHQLATLGLSSTACMQNPWTWGIRISAISCLPTSKRKKWVNAENRTLLRWEQIIQLHYNA